MSLASDSLRGFFMNKKDGSFEADSLSSHMPKKHNPNPLTFGESLKRDQILALGDSLPLKWSIYPDGRLSVRDSGWFESKFGKTKIKFQRINTGFGGYEPRRVENCLFPNGERGIAFGNPSHENASKIIWRRPTSDQGHWWPGTVKFSKDEAIFEDFEALLPIEPIGEAEQKAWLAQALMGRKLESYSIFWTEFYNACCTSDMLKMKLRNDSHAIAFFSLFMKHGFIYEPTGQELYYESDRRIGVILSRLRGCGEDYVVFSFGYEDALGPEPTEKESNELLKLFEELGFVSNTVLK